MKKYNIYYFYMILFIDIIGYSDVGFKGNLYKIIL